MSETKNLSETNKKNPKKYERYRCFDCVTYIEKDVLENFLKVYPVAHYAYITHDKDIADGNPKETHTHLLLYFSNATTLSAVQKAFKAFKQNTRVIPCDNKLRAYRYLTHEDEDWNVKYHYDKKLVITDCDEFFSRGDFTHDDDTKAFAILEQMVSREEHRNRNIYELCRKYGRELIINFDKYERLAQLVCRERYEDSKDVYAPIFNEDGEVIAFKLVTTDDRKKYHLPTDFVSKMLTHEPEQLDTFKEIE